MFIIEYYIGQWIYVRCVKLDINCLNSDILKLGQPRGVNIRTFLLSKTLVSPLAGAIVLFLLPKN